MDPIAYLSVVPGLFGKRSGPSQETQYGRNALMQVNSAYQNQQGDYQGDVANYRNQLQGAEKGYLDYLRAPVGSNAQDAATLGRANEGINQSARYAAARIANSPNALASSDVSGAENAIEHQRLAGQANLQAQVANMNLLKQQQNQKAVVDYLVSRFMQSGSGLNNALSGQAAIASEMLNTGSRNDAYKRQDEAAGQQGIMQLLAELGGAI